MEQKKVPLSATSRIMGRVSGFVKRVKKTVKLSEECQLKEWFIIPPLLLSRMDDESLGRQVS